jgi:hypothetical protein
MGVGSFTYAICGLLTPCFFLHFITIFRVNPARSRYYKKQVNPFHKTTIGKPKKWLIEAAAEIGLDYSELSHEVTNHFKEHVIKKHGKGALAITDKDFEKIPEIIRNPDMAIIGIKRKGEIRNVYVKREAGQTYLYYDETLNSNRNKALRGCTFFKIIKPLDMGNLERIVIMNERTNLSGAKKIIAAGGHPGGEA